MADRLRLHVCGARGSTPAPGPEFVRYGGHTSCVAIARGSDGPALILDAGTGIRRVTGLLTGPFCGTILLTHLHWDHVHGLPFFAAGDRDDATVRLLLPQQESPVGAEEVLARGMSPPHFPVSPGELRGAWSFGLVAPGQLQCEGFDVEAREVPHKGGRTFGYRITDGRVTVAYIPDHCPTDLGEGPDGCGAYHPAAIALAADADLLIHDAQLLPAELPAQAIYGHAAADYAVGLAEAAGSRRVLLFHHHPSRTDPEVESIGGRFEAAAVETRPAVEGSVIEL